MVKTMKKNNYPHYLQTTVLSIFLVLLAAFFPAAVVSAEKSTCSNVKIEIRQELTLERQAFDAHMRINNGLSHISLENVAIEVLFTDENGDPVLASSDPNHATALFFIRTDSMTNIDDIDGAGTVAPSTTADIHWLIIPATGASNGIEQGTLYYVGATLSYLLGGVEHVTQIAPDSIFVKPMPELVLDYFLPKNIYGDDAFTPEIEPAIPYSLGVRVRNNGAGIASQLKIDSAQSEIRENEQGLLINFVLEGSEVNGEPMIPDLRLDFGDIGPGLSGTGRWIMSCSLSGSFVDFTAEFSHSDELGGELTSLIDSVNTHTLLGDVVVDLPGRDSIRDFLTIDAGAVTVFESDSFDNVVVNHSATATLEFVASSATQEEYLLTLPSGNSFVYAQLTDPLSEGKILHSVIRSDGKVLLSDNFWLSKERDGNQNWHYFLNLFDTDSTTSYTVIFADSSVLPGAPVLQFIPDQTKAEEELLSFLVEASDPDGTIPSLSAFPLPATASFTDRGDGTALFNWTPTAGQSGTYTIVFTASDGTLSGKRDAVISIFPLDDRDGDLLPNSLEDTTCTDPDNSDSDGDGLSDGVEDANQNGIKDPGETNPCDADTDNDGYTDGEEVAAGTDPLDAADNPATAASYTLRVLFAGNGSGTVTITPPDIDCTTDCSADFSGLDTVTLTAVAADGTNEFVGWSGDINSGCFAIVPCIVTMDQAREITATFKGHRFPWTMFLPAIINEKLK